MLQKSILAVVMSVCWLVSGLQTKAYAQADGEMFCTASSHDKLYYSAVFSYSPSEESEYGSDFVKDIQEQYSDNGVRLSACHTYSDETTAQEGMRSSKKDAARGQWQVIDTGWRP